MKKVVFIDKCCVHQFPYLFGWFRGRYIKEIIQRLYGCNMVRRGTDPADFLGKGRHLLRRPPLAEFLKPLEVRNLEKRTLHPTFRIKTYIDFSMAFQPGNGIDNNSTGHMSIPFPPPRMEWGALYR